MMHAMRKQKDSEEREDKRTHRKLCYTRMRGNLIDDTHTFKGKELKEGSL